MKRKIILLVEIFLVTITLVACNLIKKELYRVTFKDGDLIYKELEVEKNSLLENPGEPNKVGYDLVGWFKNLNDETTKWIFETNKVEGHTELTAKWQRKANYLEIEDLESDGSIITWKEIADAEYEVRLLDNVKRVSENFIDISEYKDIITEKQSLTIIPIKENFFGIEKVLEIQYIKDDDSEIINLNFDKLSKGTYASAIIKYNDFSFILSDALIGSSNNDLKNGDKSVRIRNDGFIEFMEGIDSFSKMSFYLGTYTNDASSDVAVYVKIIGTEDYQLVKTFQSTSILTYVEIKDIDIPIEIQNETLIFKIQKETNANRVNIDDLNVYTKGMQQYIITDKTNNEESFELLPYYQTTKGLKGKELVEELRIILNTNFNSVSYGDARYVLERSDRDPKDNYNSVRGMYDNDKIATHWIGTGTGRWQREHVWPNSKLGIERVDNSSKSQGSDMHNLRAITGINQTRSNRFFTTGSGNAVTVGTEGFYPGDDHKGDVARILLYMAVKYEFLKLTDSEKLLGNNSATNYTVEGAYGGKISLLLDWHKNDPVDEFEIKRNEFIYSGNAERPNGGSITPQGNRNPFIDHPQLFKEVINYFLTLDEKRLSDMNISVDYLIDYLFFKKMQEINHYGI